MRYRVSRPSVNLVRPNMKLPQDMFYGSVSFSTSFEQPPTLSISYRGCTRSFRKKLENSGGQGVSFEGFPFVVRSVSSTLAEAISVHRYGNLRTYDVSLECEWKWSRELRSRLKVPIQRGTKYISTSQVFNRCKCPIQMPNHLLWLQDDKATQAVFDPVQLAVEIARIHGGYLEYGKKGIAFAILGRGKAVALPTEDRWFAEQKILTTDEYGYSDTLLSWDNVAPKNKDEDEDPDNDDRPPRFTKREPEIREFVKQTEDFDDPPQGSEIILTLDSNAHKSGPLKTKVTTTLHDGQPFKTVQQTKGFAYLSADILQGSEGDYEIGTDEPKKHWKIVEEEAQEYIYEGLSAIAFRLEAREDPTNEFERGTPLIIDPDYLPLVGQQQSDFTNFVSYKPSVEFLVRVKTRGRKWIPLKGESEENEAANYLLDLQSGGISESEFNRLMAAYRFRWVQSYGEETILLKSLRKDILAALSTANLQADKDLAKLEKETRQKSPFTVSWQDYSQLPPRIKSLVTNSKYVNKKGRVGVVTVDPNYVEQYYIARTKKEKIAFAWMPDPEKADDPIAPPLVTGEELYQEVERNLIDASSYFEERTSASGQNVGFEDFAQEVEQETIGGTPPSPNSRQARWEDREDGGNPTEADPNALREKEFDYYITSSNSKKLVNPPEQISFQYAGNLHEAMVAAKTEMQLQSLSTNASQKTIAWYYPNALPGAVAGNEIVLSASVSLEIDSDDSSARRGYRYAMTGGGTQISTGRLVKAGLTHRQEPKQNNNNSNPKDPDLSSDFAAGAAGQLGSTVSGLENRRRFKYVAPEQ
jgi:hypothetical protein